MFGNKHFTAIVLAAGKGSRMHSDIPKQYMNIAGKEVLYYSLNAFEESPVDDIIVVVSNDDIEYCKRDIIEKYNLTKVTSVIAGGEERYWSVSNGLEEASGTDYVMIHDGARPCINRDIIIRSMEAVIENGACTVGVPVKDTIKVVDANNVGVDTPDRATLWQIQTPQSFRYNDIVAAYELMRQDENINITDDTMVMEHYLNKHSKVIMGDYRNIKITTPEDVFVVENFLRK